MARAAPWIGHVLLGLRVRLQRLHRVTEARSEHGTALTPEAAEAAEADLAREANMLLRLRHPNIVALKGVVRDTDTGKLTSIVLEHANGGNLESWLHNLGRELPLSEVVLLFKQAAAGLAHIHAQDMCHCDIRPANMLVCRDGATGAPVLKLANAGDSQAMPLSLYGDYYDRRGKEKQLDPFVGAPMFRAPECKRGAAFTAKADVFSLGLSFAIVAARHMAHPTIPAEQGTFANTDDQRAVVIAGVSRLRTYCDPLSRVVKGMCDSDPTRRITSAKALSDLRAIVSLPEDVRASPAKSTSRASIEAGQKAPKMQQPPKRASAGSGTASGTGSGSGSDEEHPESEQDADSVGIEGDAVSTQGKAEAAQGQGGGSVLYAVGMGVLGAATVAAAVLFRRGFRPS